MKMLKRTLLLILVFLLALGAVNVAASSPNEVTIRLTDGTTITFVGDVVLFNEQGTVVRSDVYSMRNFLNAGYKIAGNLTKVKIYSVNGQQQVVAINDADTYFKEGDWYAYPVALLYSEDGRTVIVKVEEIESYKTVGWHENIEEVQTTLYSPNGSKITVFNAEVTSYCAVGWYTYPVCYMYDTSGNSYIVVKSEVPAYKAKGLSENISDVKTRLYSQDGRSISVFKAEVDAYVAVGWSVNETRAYQQKLQELRDKLKLLTDSGKESLEQIERMADSIERNRKTLENGGLGGLHSMY